MPSSEVTAGHNPSRISIDNGIYMYKTQKNSQWYKMKVQKHFKSQSELQLHIFSDECSKFIPNWVDGLWILEVHQVSFIKFMHLCIELLLSNAFLCCYLYLNMKHHPSLSRGLGFFSDGHRNYCLHHKL